MEPQTQPSQTSTSGSQDPQVIALAKSLRVGEGTSGTDNSFQSVDWTMKGKSGEYGAYQWTPGTWAKDSSAAGINVPLEQSTPEQQNQVAYNTISQWKREGYGPAQIASMWNAGAGEPDAYTGYFNDGEPSKGTNKEGVQYDVPSYVNRVISAYRSSSTSTNVPQPSQNQTDNTSQPSDPLSSIKNALGGAASWLFSNGGSLLKTAAPILAGAGVGALTKSPTAGIAADVATQQLLGGGGQQQQPSGGTETAQTQQPDTASLASLFSTPQSQQSQSVASQLEQEMQRNQSWRNLASSQEGQQGIGTIAIHGNLPSVDENGNYDSTEALKNSSANETKAAQIEGLAAGGSEIPLAAVINEATQQLQGMRRPPEVIKEAQQYAGEYARAYANSNDSISGEDAINARHDQYNEVKKNWGKMSSAQIEARKAVGLAMRNQALKYSKNPELQKAAIRQQQAHINERKVLKSLHNKPATRKPSVLKSALYKTAARYAEIYIGDKIGGPIGAILGYVAGEHLNHVVEKKLARTRWDTKGMKAAMDILKDTKPDAYDRILNALKASGVSFEGQQEPEEPNQGAVTADVKKDLGLIGGTRTPKAGTRLRTGLVKPPSR